MALQFENPWLLLLLLPTAAFMYYTTKNMIRLARWRRISVIFLRSLGFFIIILLLSGFTLQQVSGITTTLFLVDSSDSIKDKEQAAAFVREAIKNMGRNHEVGIINFGGNSAIELLPDRSPFFENIQTKINPALTNLENALLTAQSVMPWNHQKRVVILSDGRENVGNALNQVKQMNLKGYEVNIYPISPDFQAEVQIQELKVPESVHMNEQFEISVNIISNVDTEAILQLYSDRTLTVQKKVALNKGSNQFAFTDSAVNGGMVTYRVEVMADLDTVSQNNSLSSYTFVKDVPKIMMVAESEDSCRVLAEILKEDMRLTVVNPMQVPVELSELLKYDAFILVNVSADNLSNKFLDNLEIAVSHQGKGLLVTGGDNSYGPGGYYKTTLEKILPVNMDIKPKEEDPNLALILVIDKSGSMSGGDFGISKMELAKEAAIRSTEVLDQDDMIGVIAFDDAYKWVVEPQKLDNLQDIQDAIGTIRPGGGTQILPPLEVAYESMLALDAGLKHIILLTDGQAEKEGYEPLIDNLREKGITLSTVAVGRSADTLLMKALAYGGRGRYYETDEFTDIPKIFAKEVFLAGKKYLINRTFTPRLTGSFEILKGIDAVPNLDGYVTTTPKQTANVVFASDEDDPILACWQYGLGRSVAWTPDVQGIWTYDWMNWSGSSKFWKNVVSWIIQQNMSKGYTIETSIEGQDGIITVKTEDDAFMTASEVTGTLIGPDGTKQEIKLLPGAPGEYTGTFRNLLSGVYIADIILSGNDGRSEHISTGLIMPYSPEYDILSNNDSNTLIQKIAYEGGGRILEDPSQVFESELPPVTGKTDPFYALIIVLLVLFMLDIAFRRLNFRFEMWRKKLESVQALSKTAVGRFVHIVRTSEKGLKLKNKIKQIDDNKNINNIKSGSETIKHKPKSETSENKINVDSHISQLLDKKRKWKK
ncbi:MAG TPA: VWA domain-containing protein [Clostridiaceae bacterium]|nr:VWA domain-containing protein [Clostridiaceae bacterium]